MTASMLAPFEVGDTPELRPTLARTVAARPRLALTVTAAAAGVAATTVAHSSLEATLFSTTVGATALTAVAANWSTCGLSVAGVVAAAKQPGRPGASTPLRRLGLHAVGSLLTAIPVGTALGLAGAALPARIATGWLLGAVAVLAVLYGLHEAGLMQMPTPMRRQQLPRHWRRTMSPRRVSFLFGAIIGPGFLIFIRSSAYYLMVLGVLAVGSPVVGAACFAAVSLGRCGPSIAAIVHAMRGGSMPEFLAWSCSVDRRVQFVTGAVLVALGSFALTSLI